MTQEDSTGKGGYLRAVREESINSVQLRSVESVQSVPFSSGVQSRLSKPREACFSQFGDGFEPEELS